MSDISWQIRPESPADDAAIAALNDAGFGPGRFAKSAYRLREGVAPVASLGFVAVKDGALLGSVRFWPISVGGHEELLLGPLAVRGDQRGRGIGIALMRAPACTAASIPMACCWPSRRSRGGRVLARRGQGRYLGATHQGKRPCP